MSRKQDLRWIGETMFARVGKAFPALRMQVEPNRPDGDLWMSIPEQPGLAFPLELGLRDEELQIKAGEMELAYIPCTLEFVREDWLEDVSGLLSGELRVVETRAGGRAIQTELQQPGPEGWETIAMSGLIGVFPRRKTKRIFHNRT